VKGAPRENEETKDARPPAHPRAVTFGVACPIRAQPVIALPTHPIDSNATPDTPLTTPPRAFGHPDPSRARGEGRVRGGEGVLWHAEVTFTRDTCVDTNAPRPRGERGRRPGEDA
jgi:hypothetical protein